MEIVFIIKTTFNNSICIISCNWSCKVIRLPTLRVFCIAHTPWALTGRKPCWQRYLLTICYTTSYHRTTRIAFTPSTGLARRPVPIRYLEKGRIWWASNCYSTGHRLALSWSNSYLSNWKTCYRWRRNMHLTNWLHMAYQVIPISQ